DEPGPAANAEGQLRASTPSASITAKKISVLSSTPMKRAEPGPDAHTLTASTVCRQFVSSPGRLPVCSSAPGSRSGSSTALPLSSSVSAGSANTWLCWKSSVWSGWFDQPKNSCTSGFGSSGKPSPSSSEYVG